MRPSERNRARRARRRILALSGGEPTLNPRLLDYVELARAHGARAASSFRPAIRLGNRTPFEHSKTPVSPRHSYHHGSYAELSDAVTCSGHFRKPSLGSMRSRKRIHLRINFVFCEQNYRDSSFVRWSPSAGPPLR
jgi:hypothetical protein